MDEIPMSYEVRPKEITHDRQAHELQLAWNDGHVSTYPLNALREACPCAVCRGGHEMMGKEHDPDLIAIYPARSYKVTNIELIGHYALQVSWDDHHNAGIYTWDYLRRICPCTECQTARGDK